MTRFCEATNETILTKLVEKEGNITEKYNEWQNEVTEIITKTFKQTNKTNKQTNN